MRRRAATHHIMAGAKHGNAGGKVFVPGVAVSCTPCHTEQNSRPATSTAASASSNKHASVTALLTRGAVASAALPNESEASTPLASNPANAAEASSKQPHVRKPREKACVAVPSFAFACSRAAEGIESKAPCAAEPGNRLGTVQAFMTVAGRAGKAGSHTKSVTIEEVERMVPVSYLHNVLPSAFADHLLRIFLEESKRWHTSKRWLYDREIESHRVESGFRFDNIGGRKGSSKGFGQRWETAGFGDDLRHLRSCVAQAVQRARVELLRCWRQGRVAHADGPLSGPAGAHQLAQQTVAIASRGQRLNAEAVDWLTRYAAGSAEKGWRWEPNYCVANFYKDEEDFLGAHSDPVESIGPWAIVASLTFGAARQFRMKPVGTMSAPTGPGERVTSFSVRLPHNSLLICWEGFQEFWRHEVPKDRGLQRHQISGAARLNFTFRKSVVGVATRRPLCTCGRKAHLKPVLKETSRHRGRYFWSCSNPRVRKGEYQSCEFFQWDDELLAKQ